MILGTPRIKTSKPLRPLTKKEMILFEVLFHILYAEPNGYFGKHYDAGAPPIETAIRKSAGKENPVRATLKCLFRKKLTEKLEDKLLKEIFKLEILGGYE